jgi:hypothetical protein
MLARIAKTGGRGNGFAGDPSWFDDPLFEITA